ncbi:MAG: peptide MFS transporter [Candidatus Eisenbacteria bacterium]|nr:peptide MFS transporter [Candidatus Eisenbacteria bacterium]
MATPPGTQANIPASSRTERTILGHPRGLFVLFFTEMWERFSYYGMRSLLVLYMVDNLFLRPDVGQKVLGYSAIRSSLESIFGPLAIQPFSSQIYGLYTAFVYLTPFFGGLIADKILGQRKAVILGGILMAIGEFLLMSESLFFIGLMFLIMGNGAFKPNISTQVGGLYPPGDPRRDRAFTIFYMGINLGAFFSPLICGTLGQRAGWHWGFFAAGVGMIAGLILYLAGRPLLAEEPSKSKVSSTMAVRSVAIYIVAVAIGLIALVIGLPAFLGLLAKSIRIVLGLVVLGVLVTLFTRWMRSLPKDDRLSIGALITLCALNIVFWGVYEQQGNTMQLWADRNTNWHLLGFDIPSTWYQSINPIMIFIMAPVLNIFWSWQQRRRSEPSSVIKMAMGCVLLGLAYILMMVAAANTGAGDKRSVMWLVGTTFVLTIGELYLSPIGLSLVTKVAPARMVSMMMGVWFLSSFFGNYLTGFLGTFWEKMPKSSFFLMLTILGVSAGAAMFILSRPVGKVIAKHEAPAGS